MKRLIVVLAVLALVGTACGGDAEQPCLISNVFVDLVSDLGDIANDAGQAVIPEIVSVVDVLLGGPDVVASEGPDPDEPEPDRLLYDEKDVTRRWDSHTEELDLSDVIPNDVAVVTDADLLERLPSAAAEGSAFKTTAEQIIGAHDYLDVSGTAGAEGQVDAFGAIEHLQTSLPQEVAGVLAERTLIEIFAEAGIEVTDIGDIVGGILDAANDGELPLDSVVATIRPVYGMSYEGHWGWEPGPEAIEPWPEQGASESILQGLKTDAPTTGTRIAVVDSGFPFDGVWKGLDSAIGREEGELVVAGSPDAEDHVPSHGSFVVSVIRQVAPQAHILGAKAHLISDEHVSSDGTVTDSDEVVDELSVEWAIARLALVTDPAPSVLNLSLGTYDCPDDVGLPRPSIVTDAIGKWKSSVPGLTVVAAAGNESLSITTDHGEFEFFPAADSRVLGIAPTNSAGMVTTWSSSGQRETLSIGAALTRNWVDDAAMGIDVIGVADGEISVWSGSSFAAAVVSALKAIEVESAGEGGSAVVQSKGCPDGLMHAERDGQGNMTREKCGQTLAPGG